MKKIALALAGASIALTGLASAPAAAADFGGHDRGRYEQTQNFQNVQGRSFARNQYVSNDRGSMRGQFMGGERFQGQQWQRGERFNSRYAMDYNVIDNPGYYNLRPAPYGYRWVRSGDEAVLVAIASGLIGALAAHAF